MKKKKEGLKITRRQFLKGAAALGIGAALPLKFGVGNAYAAANSPQLAKWQWAMRGLQFPDGTGDPNGIPVLSPIPDPFFAGTNFIQLAAGEFTEQLHPALGPTTLWGYYDNYPSSGNFGLKRHLGGVMVATRNTPIRTRVTNTLPPKNIIPVDTTVQGYLNTYGENRIAVHLHGGEVPWISDGGPFDWWQPDGTSGLSFFNGPGGVLDNIVGQPMLAGQADFYYPNNQSTRLMWYHDHAHGITRLNAYAGLASGYLIIDVTQDAKLANGLPPLGSTFPLIFQDKTFVDPATIALTDPTWATVARPDVQSLGSLWYEHIYDKKEFRLLQGKKYLTPPNPSCIPEFFGDTMLTNGYVYPVLTVEAKRYRFLALNANQARFLNLNLLEVSPTALEVSTDPRTLLPVNYIGPGPQIIQIGSEGGYLMQDVYHPNNRFFNPLTLTGNLLLGTGERADIIIDFTNMAGKEYILYNDAPGPFPAGPANTDYFLGNRGNKIQPLPGTGPDTRNILRIKVVAGASDPQLLPVINPANDPVDPPFLATPIVNAGVPQPLTIANVTNIPAGANLKPVPRDLTLNEAFDLYGRLTQLLGTTTINPVTGAYGREYLEATTESIPNNTVEVWRIYNLTADTHPIHFHLANCQVLSRQPFALTKGVFTLAGAARGCEPNELGWKETVQMHPGEVTTVAFYFNLPSVPFSVPTSTRTGGNEYVWHCHILEHEEHDMMRPLVIT